MTRIALSFVLALALFGCSDDTPPPADTGDAGASSALYCNVPGQVCAAFVSGWTEQSARESCDTSRYTLATGSCPSGHVARCTATRVEWDSEAEADVERTLVTYYYSNFGDTGDPVAYALENCQVIGGSFTSP